MLAGHTPWKRVNHFSNCIVCRRIFQALTLLLLLNCTEIFRSVNFSSFQDCSRIALFPIFFFLIHLWWMSFWSTETFLFSDIWYDQAFMRLAIQSLVKCNIELSLKICLLRQSITDFCRFYAGSTLLNDKNINMPCCSMRRKISWKTESESRRRNLCSKSPKNTCVTPKCP